MKGQVVLCTGMTGSWGHELAGQLLTRGVKELRSFSRGEFAQVTTARKLNNPRLKTIIGDVRDYEAIHRACAGVDIVLHLAAIKHVPICEDQPNEAIKTNILGTQNVIEACIAQRVDKVIDVSSDKAAAPNNLYGMTKAVGERLILAANKRSSTRFKCIRGGNVLGSNGSVCQLFIDQIKKDNKVTITSKEMSRYFLTLPQAIRLLITACKFDADMLVMKMPSCRIYDLARILIKCHGNKDTKIVETGIRPGEKIHEVLVTEWEAMKAYQLSHDFYAVSDVLLNLPRVTFPFYSSNSQPYMTDKQIEVMLQKGGFLK
jgi:UDP-N-acetylglucosamine 4,6-dehydratase